MSQAKVDKYKNYKKNRRENIKKEKRKLLWMKIGAWAFVAVVVAGVGTAFGVTFYNQYQEKLAAMPTYSATSFVLSDYVGIQDEDTEEETEAAEGETEEAESVAETGTDASAAETTEAQETETGESKAE